MAKFNYTRRPTRTVFVGDIGVGGNHPIRIQSMLVSDTKDTTAVVREIEDLVNAGCEIVRLTVPTKADCANLVNIRQALKEKNIRVPLVADIHFTPSIALDVVEFVEKVRINPGNFVDKKLFKVEEYTDAEYAAEVSHLKEKFIPLVEKCKAHGVAMRIGTNHGSLSDRIMNRYGDTPEGMVESALEFLRIAAELNYHDIILSMKASNTQVMVTAYRLLAKRLDELGQNYPFHLGVTEAGDSEDGRIKSAVGIGTLLEEGIGDTIRVSLTEDSVHEIPVAGMLAAPYNLHFYAGMNSVEGRKSKVESQNPVRNTERGPVRVWTTLDKKEGFESFLRAQNADMQFEGIEIPLALYSDEYAAYLTAQNFPLAVISERAGNLVECAKADKWVLQINTPPVANDVLKNLAVKALAAGKTVELSWRDDVVLGDNFSATLTALADTLGNNTLNEFVMSVDSTYAGQHYRVLAHTLNKLGIKSKLHLRYRERELPPLIDASVQLGSLLLDGYGDSIQIDTHAAYKERLNLSYSLLQACRVRISKTEFIACPSCGRTLFDLQEVTAKIKAKTSHLKGVKIAIMGCIVNGPGEMADADFGYVGTGTGKISLYVGKDCVKRNLPEDNALDELIGLIRKYGRWVEPVLQ